MKYASTAMIACLTLAGCLSIQNVAGKNNRSADEASTVGSPEIKPDVDLEQAAPEKAEEPAAPAVPDTN